MSKKIRKILIIILVALCLMSLTACGTTGSLNNDDVTTHNAQVYSSKTTLGEPEGEYKQGFALVKFDGEFTESMVNQLGLNAVNQLYKGSSWYSVEFRDKSNTEENVKYLDEIGCFDKVDYDYIMGADVEVDSIDVSCNPHYDKQKHHNAHKIPEGWEYARENGKNPGGSSDVIVAVIDTGVDYNHLDLRNNIWKNPAEIPGNGIDDDKNGYIDDINGWDCVGNDNDPMDDNGHGTHVAGIIAMENNDIGGVGIAYNCKIMVLKAGNSSGYFNNSDIAEAIEYAYMNGASVINMSFGGTSISIAVEEALENAYNSCVLVAAAGNDGVCNNLACTICRPYVGVSYPAALPYVIGVMSTNGDGTIVSGFSNYDHCPFDSIEYEVYAVGESVPSCWPNNKYAKLNGTSMAAPTVSGIVALLRSAYPDRDTYSTKYLLSQIVNTGTINPHNNILGTKDSAHSVANVYEALTLVPTPDVKLYGYSISDSVDISNKNNGNGVIDAGETVRLSIALQNRGGVATDVNVSIDTIRNGDASLTDPYFTFVNNTMSLSDIGTYSVRESGVDNYFEIIVDSNCPNDYLTNFNLHFTYKNGMDSEDHTEYRGEGNARFNISKGWHLPANITEDTVFTADRLYIVGNDVVIPEGVIVTFEEGCQIQFYDDREYYSSPKIINYGTLNFNGTKENMVKISPNERHFDCICLIENHNLLNINYLESLNFFQKTCFNCHNNKSTMIISNSRLLLEKVDLGYYEGAFCSDPSQFSGSFENDEYFNNHIELLNGANVDAAVMKGNVIVCYTGVYSNFGVSKQFQNNIIYSLIGNTSIQYDSVMKGDVSNNLFVSVENQVSSLLTLSFYKNSDANIIANNAFSSLYQQYASQVIEDYYDEGGNPTIDVYGECSDISLLYPHVTKVQFFNKDGEEVTTIGKEEITVRVTFNRAMDTTQNTLVTFGTIEPYADYRIDGEYISNIVWEGKYTLKSQIENGLNYLKINNACQEDDITKQVLGEYQLHEFNIDTTAAMSMNLQAIEKENGIELTFAQDDYDTLLGYNIYRSTEKDGNYIKLNTAIILSTENTFLDENAEPGKTYWYTYTVVLSDFTETKPAGKVMATAMDTINPTVYHTPVNQGYQNNNLVISCTASDNVAISTVTLYYRTLDETVWKTLVMSKTNDKYSATIFGSELTLDRLEYYIVASDGRNAINKGTETAPYIVVIKDASIISTLGDVDGNGTVTTKDALMLMQCLNGDLILSDDEFKRADLNKDNVLSSVEALRILQYINGKVTTLEM